VEGAEVFPIGSKKYFGAGLVMLMVGIETGTRTELSKNSFK